MGMTFKEFYVQHYPEHNGDWGSPGELMHLVQQRICDQIHLYVEYVLKEKVDEIYRNHRF